MIIYEKTKPLIKRTPTITDTTDKILRFDTDNLYPQRMEELFKRSTTLKSVYGRLADFINGEGFQDQALAKMIFNCDGLKGTSGNRLLKQSCLPYAKWSTFCAHINYNMLGEMCSIRMEPISNVRFGLKDASGKIVMYGYSANWERDGRSMHDRNIVFYNRFNPDPEIVLAQMEQAGGIAKYKGQILYLTPEEGCYPLTMFDSVSDDAQTQAEIALTKVNNIQSNFLATLAVVYHGEFASKQEEMDFRDLIASKSGSRNAGSRIGIQDKTGQKKASDIFQNLAPVSLDKLYELTESTVKANIIENEAFPQILLGKSPTGLFAQGDIEEAYTYVNAITRNRRSELSEIFALLFSYWEQPIQTDASIVELRYLLDAPVNSGVDINDNLKNMTGMQAINFERILRKYEQGKLKRDVATLQLQQGFGLSSDEIQKLLDGIDALVLEEKGTDATAPAKAAAMKSKKIKYYKESTKEYLMLNEIYQ